MQVAEMLSNILFGGGGRSSIFDSAGTGEPREKCGADEK
jgi:hypothetical protein